MERALPSCLLAASTSSAGRAAGGGGGTEHGHGIPSRLSVDPPGLRRGGEEQGQGQGQGQQRRHSLMMPPDLPPQLRVAQGDDASRRGLGQHQHWAAEDSSRGSPDTLRVQQAGDSLRITPGAGGGGRDGFGSVASWATGDRGSVITVDRGSAVTVDRGSAALRLAGLRVRMGISTGVLRRGSSGTVAGSSGNVVPRAKGERQ